MVKHNKVSKKKNEEKVKKKNTSLNMSMRFFLYRTERICVASAQTTIDFWETKVYDEQKKVRAFIYVPITIL